LVDFLYPSLYPLPEGEENKVNSSPGGSGYKISDAIGIDTPGSCNAVNSLSLRERAGVREKKG
jgi:hypothetical protein